MPSTLNRQSRCAARWMLVLTLGAALSCSRFALRQPLRNFAHLPISKANDPALIDGEVATHGESFFPDYPKGTATPPSEATVTLGEPRAVIKVVLHTSQVEAFDVLIHDPATGWHVAAKRDGQRGPTITVAFNRPQAADAVRIRVRRTPMDAALRRQNATQIREEIYIEGPTRAPAKIGEIEIWGLATPSDDE